MATPLGTAAWSHMDRILRISFATPAAMSIILRGEKPADLPVDNSDQSRDRNQPQHSQGPWRQSTAGVSATVDEVVD